MPLCYHRIRSSEWPIHMPIGWKKFLFYFIFFLLVFFMHIACLYISSPFFETEMTAVDGRTFHVQGGGYSR